MAYEIVWKKSAVKELSKIDKINSNKIYDNISELSKESIPNNSKKLKGTTNNYRLRIGDFRVIYSIYQNTLIIEIIKIAHRKDIYKRL